MEFLLTNSPYPELALGMKTTAEQGLAFAQAMFDARSALMAERLHRSLSRHESHAKSTDNRMVEWGGRELLVDCRFGPHTELNDPAMENACVLRCASQPMVLSGWSLSDEPIEIPAGTPVVACFRPYELGLLGSTVEQDWGRLRQAARPNRHSYLVVPCDVHLLPAKLVSSLTREAGPGCGVLVCPDLCSVLTAEATQKIGRGEFVRS
jgi:hypothetical protein